MSGRKPGKTDGSVGSDRSVGSKRKGFPKTSRRIRPSGGYRKLRSFRVATIIYDATVLFCSRFLDKKSRTVDQMIQAARSGRQNIAEGSRASATSSQTELRLLNVARASLDELLPDYEDFLRHRGMRQWQPEDPEAQEVRAVAKSLPSDPPDPSDPTHPSDWQYYAQWIEHDNPAIVANTLICLIHQANYLLDRQVAGLEREFIHQGGYSETLAAARIEERKRRNKENLPDKESTLPKCPRCGQPMTLRTARKGPNAGSRFWGCTAFPDCRGTRPYE